MGKGGLPAKTHKIDRLYIRDGGCCWICGNWGPVVVFNRDHLIPRSLGGPNGMWNLRLCHPTCNAERNLAPPPLELVLQYCDSPGLKRRAARLYLAAYPRGVETEQSMVRGRMVPVWRKASLTPGPPRHTRYPSHACAHCNAWCGSCRSCWCTAAEHDHDVIKIRSAKVALGIHASP